jgi:hypothetical protein
VTRFFLYALLAAGLVTGVCVFIIRLQGKRVKSYKAENENLRRANREAASRLEHIREYISKNEKVTEAANAERGTLNATPDSGLCDRANTLFLGTDAGVREPGGGNGGTGGAAPARAARTGNGTRAV